MTRSSKQFFAIAWYTPQQWRLLKRKAVDAHLLDSSYQQWLEEAEKLIARLQLENQEFAKCFVDVEELEKWCCEEGLPLDGAARSRFVAETARSEHQQ